MIDHLPQAVPPDDPQARRSYEQDLAALGKRPNVYVKGSEILRSRKGPVSVDLNLYRPWLDEIWEMFGEDRLLFASDWPNSDGIAPFATHVDIIREYVAGKGARATEKFFWKNSTVVYRWTPRDAAQRELMRG